MNPLDIIRMAGMVLAMFLFAKYLKYHPDAFDPIKPRVILRVARSFTRWQ